MSLRPPLKVEKLRATLHSKAKKSPEYRFYTLYDKVCREDFLAYAYRLSRLTGGSAGVDGESFQSIESVGAKVWLAKLAEELRKKTYRPEVALCVWIEEANGGRRPLGMPTIRDRVVQTATVLVLEPIFEADLPPEPHAYRAGKSTHGAVRRPPALASTGHRQVVDADLSAYLDSLPHAELLEAVSRRVSDGRVLRLIKLWLRAQVVELRGPGRRCPLPRATGRGCPQGAPISPLLANLSMRPGR